MFFFFFFNIFFFKNKKLINFLLINRFIACAFKNSNNILALNSRKISEFFINIIRFNYKNKVVIVSLFMPKISFSMLNLLLGRRFFLLFFFNLRVNKLIKLSFLNLSKKKKYFFFLDKLIRPDFLKFIINNKFIYFLININAQYLSHYFLYSLFFLNIYKKFLFSG